MNYWEIGNKYPRAYKLMLDWIKGKANFVLDFNTRGLFDFFDEQGIYILIDKNYSTREQIWHSNMDSLICKTRTEAEEKAFEKAFEILENKLGK